MFKSNSAYSNQISHLRAQILNKFGDIKSNLSTRISIKNWFDFAGDFWEFSKSLNHLIDFRSLSQKREDLLVIKCIDELVDRNLENDWKLKIKKLI